MKNQPIVIAGQKIEPGTRATVLLPSADMFTQTHINLPIHVFHGKEAGPKLFVTSTIHGDEINGIEIIRRLHKQPTLKKLRGTLITIPVANVFGFLLQSRYMPDRRDLNRSFPGHNNKGSLAAKLANILIKNVVEYCDIGIDLHTGSAGRINLPQLRINTDVPRAEHLSRIFDVPVVLDAKVRDGSLREAARDLGVPVLVYESGEALRFNEMSIHVGVRGILNVMCYLKMIPNYHGKKPPSSKSVLTQTSRWVRASSSGLLQTICELTKPVESGQQLAWIHDPFLMNPSIPVYAPFAGILIGALLRPLVNEGDALFHIASIKKRMKNVEAYIDELIEEVNHEP